MKTTLFLDIDGVLVTTRYWKYARENGLPHSDPFNYHIFDPVCVENFHKLIDNFDIEIVLSSTWRFLGIDSFRNIWNRRNMRGHIVGCTPSYVKDSNDKIIVESDIRGIEIQKYIDDNSIERYIILDDDKDMLPNQMPFFVKTEFEWGFTEDEYKKAKSIIYNFYGS